VCECPQVGDFRKPRELKRPPAATPPRCCTDAPLVCECQLSQTAFRTLKATAVLRSGLAQDKAFNLLPSELTFLSSELTFLSSELIFFPVSRFLSSELCPFQ